MGGIRCLDEEEWFNCCKRVTHSAGVKFKCHRTGQRRLSIDDGRSGRCEQKKRYKGRQEAGGDTKEGAMVIRSSRRDTAATAQSSSHGSEYKTTALKFAAQSASSAWCKHPISPPHCVLCLLTILGVCTPVYVPQCTPVLTILGQPDLLHQAFSTVPNEGGEP